MRLDDKKPICCRCLTIIRRSSGRISRNVGRFDHERWHFHLLTLEKFWIKRFLVNPKVASLALQTLVPFSLTYLCEKGFSALVLFKSKQWNRLAVDSDLTIALAKTEPRIDQLVQTEKLKYLTSKMFSIWWKFILYTICVVCLLCT